MLLLFVSMFFASITFLVFFLTNLADDLKRQSLRPLFAILPALAFWLFTLPALLAPEVGYVAASPAYNTIISGTTIGTITVQYPTYNDTSLSQGLSLKTYNSYFPVWLAILTLILLLIALWYYLLLQQKSREALREGSGAVEGFSNQRGFG